MLAHFVAFIMVLYIGAYAFKQYHQRNWGAVILLVLYMGVGIALQIVLS